MVIESLGNPKIKRYIKARDSKKFRRSEKIAAIEGARFCADAFNEGKKSRLEIDAFFITAKAYEKYSNYFDGLDFENDRHCFFVTEKIAEKLSDTENPQGVFMLVKMWHYTLGIDMLKADGRYVVLNNVQDPGNVGTVIRTADALGLDGAVLVNNCCELYNPKLLRSTMGSAFRLPVFIADSFEQAALIFDERKIITYAAVVDENAAHVGTFDFVGGCAAVIGNEGAGLCSSDISMCSEKITIAMAGNAESLNAATAAAILLWEMSKRE